MSNPETSSWITRHFRLPTLVAIILLPLQTVILSLIYSTSNKALDNCNNVHKLNCHKSSYLPWTFHLWRCLQIPHLVSHSLLVTVTVIITIGLIMAVSSFLLLQFKAVLSDMSRFTTKRTLISSGRVTVTSTIVVWMISILKWLMTDPSTISALTFELTAEQCMLFEFFTLLIFVYFMIELSMFRLNSALISSTINGLYLSSILLSDRAGW
jgi:hypothetical protein